MEQEQQINFNGLTCNYTIKGKGKAILLIHGFCFTGSSWRHIENGLHENYKIITPTLPGFNNAPITDQIDIPSLAELMVEILRRETIDEVVIFGHSMGGYIALEMADKFANIKKGIGLIHSHPYSDNLIKIKSRNKGINFIEKYGSGRYAKETIPYLFDDDFKKKNKQIIEALVQDAGSVAESTIIAYLNAIINRKDQSEILQKVDVPVLFILGEADNSLPLEQGLEQVTLPDAALLKILFGIGHLGIIEKPELVDEAMKSYLNLINY